MLTLCVKEPGGGERELSLVCGTHTIGRDKNNDIVLSDNFVSTTHARISCEDNRFFIEGMGTKGVYLNDERITEKSRLENGVTLKIGDTEIQVSSAAPDELETMVVAPSDEDPTLLPKSAGKPAYKREKDGTIMPGKKEIAVPEEEKDLNQDDTTLKFVDYCSASVRNKPEKGSGLLKKSGKWILALFAASIFLVLSAVFYFQVNPDIKGLEKSEPEKKANEISELEKISSKKEITAPNEIQPSEDDTGKANQMIRQGLVYYIKGNVEASLKEFDKIASLDLTESASLKTDAATYRNMISQTETLYLEGEQAYKQERPEAAFQVWARLIEIDHRLIGQKSSHFSSRISEYMCSEYAKRARRAFDNADYEEAHKNCQKALTIKPGLQSALDIENRLSERAEKLYGEGVIIEELDPEMAIQKWQEILTICDPENIFYKKASSRLARY